MSEKLSQNTTPNAEQMAILNDEDKSGWEKLNEIQDANDSNATEAQKMDIWNDEELSSAEKIQQINDLGEEAVEAAGITPPSPENSSAQVDATPSTEMNNSNPDRRAAAEAAVSRFKDFTPEGYKRRGAKTADRILKIYENEGTKGLVFAALRKVGRVAYRVSGLEREVRGMNRVLNAGKRTAARIENAGTDMVDSVKQMRDDARERSAARAEKREKRRAERRAEWNEFKSQVRDAADKNRERKTAEKDAKTAAKAEKKALKQQERDERARQEVMAYQAFLLRKAEATARKEARKQSRKEWRANKKADAMNKLGEIKDTGVDYMNISKETAAKFGRAALLEAKGAAGYVKGAATAINEAGKFERNRAMNA